MAISSGDRLGPYAIVSPLGEGGMGAVWKAQDTRLDRTVAIKISKEEFSDRFEREARAVAALNHPHICQLYDVGPNFLVMEYIEGTPLQGPLPVEKAVEYGVQILDALDTAHRKGVVHRDLKPANILVTKQGIKLLDFGLAKQSGVGLKETDSTLTEALTSKGQILGTLHYMSPEQVQGREADARSDIFSFGLVLYEMLTGARAFEAESGASLIAALLKDDPRPVRELQPGTPPALERILKVCLAKDPEERWQSARDLRRELAWVPTEPPGGAAPAVPPQSKRWSTRWWAPLAATALLAGLAIGFGASYWRGALAPESAEVLPLTTLAGIEDEPALSPDGKLVAFTWTGADYGPPRICVKQLDSGEPLVLSRAAQWHGSPAWSPDGRQIAYLRAGDAGTELLTVSALGGPERRVGTPWDADLDGGLCWLPAANQILGSSGRLVAVSADSGAHKPWTNPPKSRADMFPALSPDARALAFLRCVPGIASAPGEILVQHLNARQQPEGEPVTVAPGFLGVRGMVSSQFFGEIMRVPRRSRVGDLSPVGE